MDICGNIISFKMGVKWKSYLFVLFIVIFYYDFYVKTHQI